MTSADFRDEPATEVLDLYDVLPEAGRTPARTEDDAVTAVIKRVGRNLAAIIGMFAVYLPAFVVCTTLFSLGIGLAILGVGVLILIGCLMVAGWSARMSRQLLAYAGVELPPTRYPAGPSIYRRLGHAQSWRDLMHVLVNFVLATFTFSVAVSWVASGPGGLTYWFWSRWLRTTTRVFPACWAFRDGSPTSPSTPCSG
jgi:hypothetical protein